MIQELIAHKAEAIVLGIILTQIKNNEEQLLQLAHTKLQELHLPLLTAEEDAGIDTLIETGLKNAYDKGIEILTALQKTV